MDHAQHIFVNTATMRFMGFTSHDGKRRGSSSGTFAMLNSRTGNLTRIRIWMELKTKPAVVELSDENEWGA